MCNASNHAPNCNCGWGHGVNQHFRYGRQYIKPSTAKLVTGTTTIDTSKQIPCYLNPNAKCPVCKTSVFYYQNAHGSRVFFDTLSPNWSKHPCTDNYEPIIHIAIDTPVTTQRNNLGFKLTSVATKTNSSIVTLIGQNQGQIIELQVNYYRYIEMDLDAPMTLVLSNERFQKYKLTTLDKDGYQLIIYVNKQIWSESILTTR